MLRCVQLGISLKELSMLSVGMVTDMCIEQQNDDCEYSQTASQEDFDNF